jgi:hypothetical protein
MPINPYPDGERYGSAAVCRRGHVATGDYVYAPSESKFCSTCGAPIISACESCGARIKGSYRGGIVGGYAQPDFCDQCGQAHPWAGRAALIYRLKDLVEQEQLEPAERQRLLQTLDALENPEVDEEAERRFVSELKRIAPKVVDQGLPILREVITKAVLQQLGL